MQNVDAKQVISAQKMSVFHFPSFVIQTNAATHGTHQSSIHVHVTAMAICESEPQA